LLPLARSRFILRNSGNISSGTTNYQLPMECPSNSDSAGRPCTGSNFIPQEGQGCTLYTNHQELRVQEQMQCLEPGSVPASIAVTVQDELADCCQPGGEGRTISVALDQVRMLLLLPAMTAASPTSALRVATCCFLVL
jgi:DNA replicative helicase MCM subunit Mcm2 (Cdc46/Mcm family)